MNKLVITAALAAGLVGAAGCAGPGGSSSGSSGTKTLTLAPIVDALPWDLKDAGLGNNTIYYQPVYDSLMRQDPTGKVIANVATEWKYDDTANLVLTLKIRSDVKFSDGTALDAAAVKANLEHTKTGASEAAGQLKGVKSVDVVDPTTVKITLAAPDPSFVFNLGSVAGMLASPKAITGSTLKTDPVGSGPYLMDKSATTAGSVYTFKRNPNYWNKSAFPFDKIVLKPLTEATAQINALRSGQVDGGLITSPKNVAPLQAGGLNILKYNPGDVNGVYIWDRGGKVDKPLGNLKVRQAINYAFDRDALVKGAFQGLGKPTLQVFNPASTAFDDSLNTKYPYDPAKAKALLTEAGYPNGFEVKTVDLSGFFPDAQAAMVEQLGAVGIKVKLVTVPPNQVINQLLAGKFGITFFSLASFQSWDTVVIQLKQDSLWNPFKYEDPKVTALITKAQSESGDAAAATFKELDTYITDQAWNAPWTVVQNAYAYSKKVTVVPQEFTPVPYIYDFKPAS